MSKLATEEMTACPTCDDLTFNTGDCFHCLAIAQSKLPAMDVLEMPLMKDICIALGNYRTLLVAIKQSRIGHAGDHTTYTMEIASQRVHDKLLFIDDIIERLTHQEAANV